MEMSRREWMLGCAAATAALGLGASTSASAAASQPHKFKLSIAAYSYRKHLPEGSRKGSMTLFDLCDLAAQMGFDAIEPTSYYFTSEEKEYLHALKAKAFRLGLDVSGTAIRNDFCHPDKDQRAAEIAHVNKWVDHAVEFGAPCIRVFGGNQHKEVSGDKALKLVIEGLKESCDYAATRGVFLGIENHGYLTQSADPILEILEQVDNEWLGVNLDSGNFTENPYQNMERLAPHAVNVQLKTDVVTDDGSGRIPGDYERILRILKQSEYRGYVALEYEGGDDPNQGVPVFLQKVREAASKIEA